MVSEEEMRAALSTLAIDYEAKPPRRELAPSRWAWGELSECVVYFIAAVDERASESPIKIGSTRAPAIRLRELQAHCPYTLEILALARGGTAKERQYHQRFARHRLHGEWFAPAPEIVRHVRWLGSREPRDIGCFGAK